MIPMNGYSWATLQFEFTTNGETRTAVVHLTARGTGESFEDYTYQVGEILVQGVLAKPGFELVKADLITEVGTQVYPPQQ